ncbi:MAG: endonuclease III, partial [Candidatus Thermoplasmatota archaeon]|nr:endonuclease III [Candidatus Thermoplasmatota archaeon]
MQKEKIDNVMNILQKHYINHPQPLVSRDKWEHIPKTPYTVLISCLLSLRTKDEVTEEASIRLLEKYNTPQTMITIPKQ